MAKKLTKELSDEAISITFANGETLTLAYSELSEEIKFRLFQHGLSQKAGDASAGTETVEEAISETKRVLDRLRAGDWKSVREAAAGPKIGLLVEALMRLTGKSSEDCRMVVDSLDDDKRKALRAHQQIKAAMADIRAERERERAKASDGGGEVDLRKLFG